MASVGQLYGFDCAKPKEYSQVLGFSGETESSVDVYRGGRDPSTSVVPVSDMVRQDDDKVAIAIAAEAFAKATRETAGTLRSRAQAFYAIADAAMQKAFAAVGAADAIHAAERANEEAAEKENAQPVGHQRQQRGDVPVAVKDDPSRRWGCSNASGDSSFCSCRSAFSASNNANQILS